MTTTVNRPAVDDDNEFRHGPFMAAFNIAGGALTFTALGKTFGVPPWVALLATVMMVGAVVVSGKHHQPRPLSRLSVAYRSTAVLLCGGWAWYQLGTFPSLGLSHGQTMTLAVAWPATIAAVFAAVVARRVPLLIRVAGAGLIAMFTAALTLTLGDHVASWLHNVFAVTDPMPHGVGPVFTWLGASVLQLMILASPMGVVGRHTANREQTLADEAERAAQAAVPAATPQARKMLKLICDSTNEYRTLHTERGMPQQKVPLIRIEDVRPWDNGAGETYVLNLADVNNAEVKTLRTHASLWAQKLSLPNGCGIEVLNDSESRAKALVKVSRVNVLKKMLPYPQLMPRTIMNALPLGETRDGREIGPFFRENSCFLWGQKGSGKTGTIFDIIAGGLQCTDALVWVIDLNGGAAGVPFLRPWAEGKVDRPCVDWVASDLSEVLAMTEVGLRIALDRKIFYRDLKFKHNTNLMPVGNGEPGAAPPEIIIVIDEGATVLGVGGGDISDVAKQARHNLNQIMDLARDAAVNIVFSGLRATADVADTAFKAGTSIRIGMRVTDATELAYGFGRYDLDPADIPEKGSGFICCGHGDDDDDVQVFKAYYLDPKRNYEVGAVTTGWRPYMDERGMRMGGEKYANRWHRTVPKLWQPNEDLSEDRLDEMANYGALPVSAAQRQAASTAGTATAVVDQAQPAGPVSGIDTNFAQPADGSGTYADMMAAAAELRKKLNDPGDGSSPQDPPVDQGPPPSGPEPVAAAAAADDEDDGDDDDPERWLKEFRDIANRLDQPGGVLSGNPEDARPRQMPVPPESEIAANPRSREIVERILKAHGPLGLGKLHRMLNSGGAWGPATKMSQEGLRLMLRKPESLAFLAPREHRAPYQHKDNIQ